MRVIALDLEILDSIIVYAVAAPFENQARKWPGLPGQLQPGLIEMIQIEMNIPADPDELAEFQIALLRDHRLKSHCARPVERVPEQDIDAALEQKA